MSDLDVRKQHATWLALIESGGPFLTLPVLTTVLSHGLDPVRKPDMDALRLAWSTWETEQGGKNTERAQNEWVEHVVRDLLGWEGDADLDPPPGKWEHTEPEYDTLTAAAFTLNDPDRDVPALLGFTVPYGTSLTARSTDGWSASALDRVAVTLREHDIPLGLLTDGRWWGLVWAPRGGATAHALWDSVLWIEDRVTLEAFITLLGRRRILGVAEPSTLLGMLKASLDSQEEVTDQLGRQVRAAVETLVDSISRTDEQARSRGGDGAVGYLDGVSSDTVYEAAVTVLMRLVFMLAAEERRLLPVDEDLYAKSYGVATLGHDLDLRAADEGEDALDHGLGAWQRMLAAFRVVHDGADHHDFRLPGYGGGLFDPERYPWLEGRTVAGLLPPMPIDDRTVRRVVRSLMWLEFRDKGVRENRRVTYRALDVEQIGYVYEGLLDHNAVRANSCVLGFGGPNEPELTLDKVTAAAAASGEGFTAWLGKEMGKPAKWVSQRLGPPSSPDERDELWRRVLAATGNDERQAKFILPFARLLREDQRGLPVVMPTGRIYVTASSDRSDTGTHYTPRTLAETVVARALDSLVYAPGPLQTGERTQWRILAPDKILALRVADIAMGSGAFLVAACRYLADRLIEALIAADPDTVHDSESITLWFLLQDDTTGAETSEEGADEALIHARRLVAERCLYGVDINPLAVEMAKLSLWLITSAQHRPFSFLDHRLVAGDSLLGLTSLAQLENLHVRAARGRDLHANTLLGETAHVRRSLSDAATTRREIERRPSTDLREIDFKSSLLVQADRQLSDLSDLADAISGAAMAGAKLGPSQVDSRTIQAAAYAAEMLGNAPGSREHALASLEVRALSAKWLSTDWPTGLPPRRPVQWLTRFPEVFLSQAEPGFDAVVGNPPFLGGKRISTVHGSAYEALIKYDVEGRKGAADLSAHFVRRAWRLVRADAGVVGLITTDRISQGDTAALGLEIVCADADIFYARTKFQWPGSAATYASVLHFVRGIEVQSPRELDGVKVDGVTSALTAAGDLNGPSQPLAMPFIASIGTSPYGEDFVVSREDPWRSCLSSAEMGRLKPYLGGQDLMSGLGAMPSRDIIDLTDVLHEEFVLRQFPNLYQRLATSVRPDRAKLKGQIHQHDFWRFWDLRSGLYEAVSDLQRAIVCARLTRVPVFALVESSNVIFSDQVVVIASSDPALAGMLQAFPHSAWMYANNTNRGAGVRYVVSRCLRTFPFADEVALGGILTASLEYIAERQRLVDDGLTLTRLMNGLDDPSERRFNGLRDLQIRLDEETMRAYGWGDVTLEHGIRSMEGTARFFPSAAAQKEVVARLRQLNAEKAPQAMKRSVGRVTSTIANDQPDLFSTDTDD